MKRKTTVKNILSYINSNDVVIFLGSGLSKESYSYDKDGYFYIKEDNCDGLAIALGIAMNTDKRVFVFCNDSDLLKNISYMLNIAVSGCKNIFIIILNSGKYQESGGQPTIFDSISAPKGVLFNMGFVIYDYTNYLKNKNSMKELRQLIERNIGPVVIFIKVSLGIDNSIEDTTMISNKLLCNRVKTFIQDTSMGTSLYKGV